MRLLNIKTGFLEKKELNDIKEKYVAISHRWIKNEITLSSIGAFNITDNFYLGKFLLKNRYFGFDIKNHDWKNYLNSHDELLDNHYKLLNIIKCSLKKNMNIYG